MKVLVLIDGEHYPSVTRWGLDVARTKGHEVVAALFLGGTEKIDSGTLPDFGVPTRSAAGDLRGALAASIARSNPQAVLDLSDEPVLGYRERMELVAVSLSLGVSYIGSDFRFDPPVTEPALAVPTIAVIGTGKRTGKTAIAGQLARLAADGGHLPMIVAMGRGGPAEPQIARAGSVTVERLLELLAEGHHAASDYLEDALTSGVTTVGARRVGGGVAGAAFATNAREAAQLAVHEGAGLVILEGSGAAVPPVPWDAGVLVAPADVPEEYVRGYLGPYRLLRSDLVLITMASGLKAGPEHLSTLKSHVHRWHEDARFVVSDFEPVPLGDVRGKIVFLTTTAPEDVAQRHIGMLEAASGCKVVGLSARLADRAGLAKDLQQAGGYEVLLTELKAAAVDVACRTALDRGAEIVFLDNRAVAVEGSPAVDESLQFAIDLAIERRTKR
jgi:cyclic 2,3-diphosphoglycerate synthetase